MIGVLLQGLVAAAGFLLPGLWVLQGIGGNAARKLPAAYRLGLAYLVSSLVLGAYQALSLLFLPAAASRAAAWVYLAAVVLGTLGGGWRVCRTVFAGAGAWERRTWWLLGGLFVAWLSLMPLSPYPSQLTVGLGDRPAYYRLAANLVNGKGWLLDCYFGDFAGGTLPYLASQPLPVFATTFLLQIFGVNGHSLSVYCAVAGILHVALLARFVARAASPRRAGAVMLGAAVAALAVPIYMQTVGIGVTTVPGALAFLLVAVFAVDRGTPARWRLPVFALGVAFMLVVRPEACILALLFAVLYPLLCVLRAPRRRVWQRAVVVALLLAAGVAGWWKLPTLVRHVPAGMRNLSVFYVRYDPGTRAFAPMYSPWWKINKELCRANLSADGAAMPRYNEDIAAEIKAHPLAFAEYMRARFASVAWRSASAVIIDSYLAWEPVVTILVALVILFAFADPRNVVVLLIVLANMLLLPLVNAGYSARHMLPFVPVLYALFARAVLARPSWMLKRLAVAVSCALVGLSVLDIALVRRDWFNRMYTPLLDDVAALVEPGDVVATSYPPLLASEIGCSTVGGSWLTPNLNGLIERFAPDIILVDNCREGYKNYAALEKKDFAIEGYVLVRHEPRLHYAIYMSEERYRRNAGRLGARKREQE